MNDQDLIRSGEGDSLDEIERRLEDENQEDEGELGVRSPLHRGPRGGSGGATVPLEEP